MKKKSKNNWYINLHKGIFLVVAVIFLLFALLIINNNSAQEKQDIIGNAIAVEKLKSSQEITAKIQTSSSQKNTVEQIALQQIQQIEPIVSGVVFLRQRAQYVGVAESTAGADANNYFISDFYFNLESNTPLLTIAIEFPKTKKQLSIAFQCLQPAKQTVTKCLSTDKRWVRELINGKWIIKINHDMVGDFSQSDYSKQIWDNLIFYTNWEDAVRIECNPSFTKCSGVIPVSVNYLLIESADKLFTEKEMADDDYNFYELAGPLCPINSDNCKSETINVGISIKGKSTVYPLSLKATNNYYQQFDDLKSKLFYGSNVVYKADKNQYKTDKDFGGKGCYCKQSILAAAAPVKESAVAIIPKEKATVTDNKVCFDVNNGKYTIGKNSDGTYTIILKESQ